MARTFNGRQKHSGQSSLSYFMQESAEIAGIKDYQAKQAAKAQADEALVLADWYAPIEDKSGAPADLQWQDGECACYELPDGRQYTCEVCKRLQRDEDLVDYYA